MSDVQPGDDLDQSRMTVLEHLQELRKRLRNAGLVLVASGLVASYWANDFFQFLARPVAQALRQLGQEVVIIRTSPTEGFWVQFKLSPAPDGKRLAVRMSGFEFWNSSAPPVERQGPP